MIIYFLRHASAGEHLVNPKKDEKRALDKEGIEQCGYVGRALAAIEAQVDVIISSPLKRATQTASLVGNEMGYEGKLQIDTGLRPQATLADFRRMLEKYSRQESVMVVGHNPNLSQFLGTVISESGCEASVELKKGAVARVDMRRSSGTLQWCLTPKALRTLYTTAVESAASLGASAAVEDQGLVAVGLTNTTHFVRPLTSGQVTVTAVALAQGRTQQLWQVDIKDQAGRLIAHGELRLQNVKGQP